MRRFFLIFLCVLSLNAAETVKIGVNIGLSARGQTAGTNQLQLAMMLAESELNARSEAPYQYKLIFEDNFYTPQGAATVVSKLTSIDKVDGLITIYDFAVPATLPVAKRTQTPSLGLAWGVKFADAEYNFIFGYSEIASARCLYEGLKQSEEKPTAILAVKQAAIPSFVEELQRLAKVDGKAPINAVYFNPGELDFRTILLKVQNSGAKRLILLAWGAEMNKILYQLKQTPDFKPELWGFGYGFRTAEERPNLAGCVIFAPAELNTAFAERYEAFAKLKPVDNDAYGYDAVMLMAKALENSPADTKLPVRARLTEGLRALNGFSGVTGAYQQEGGVFDTSPKLFRLTAEGEEPFKP